MLLKDKVIVVTGVGPGMGVKLCKLAAREGAAVVLSARSADVITDTAQEICGEGGRAVAVRADVGRKEDCIRLAAESINAFGRIDGLVNSAYRYGTFTSFEEADLDDWRASYEVTLFGALQMIQAVLPSMKSRGGAIVNVSTMEARKPLAEHGSYSLPKAALHAATRQLALELGKYNIRVNNAVIGWMWGVSVEGYMTSSAKENGVPVQQLIDEVARNIPLRRIPTDADCAKSVVLLLSDYASEVTGAALDINGGEFLAL